MASLANFLYPPLVDSAMPSFIRSESCRIYFEINDFNSISNISGMQIILYKQESLAYAIPPEISTSRVIGIRFGTTLPVENNKYYIDLPPQVLGTEDGTFENNTYYKVQLRFVKSGCEEFWKEATSIEGTQYYGFSSALIYKYLQCFSEWSTGCLIRGINIPRIEINGMTAEDLRSVTYKTNFYEITGQLIWKDAKTYADVTVNSTDDNRQYETLQNYRFKIFLQQEGYDTLLVDSGVLYPTDVDSSKSQVYYKIPCQFELGSTYKITIDFETSYGYKKTNVLGDWFQLLDSSAIEKLEYKKFDAVCNNEEGYIQIQLQGTFKSNLCIRRADSETDFTVWEVIKYIPIITTEKEVIFHFEDYTVKSGVFYQYGVQSINTQGVHGKLYKIGGKDAEYYTLHPYFEHMYLTHGGKQFKIKYNRTVSDYKHVVKESVSETLGSQYPYIRRNANVNYRSFHIQGLISYQSDEKHLLISKNDLHRQIETSNDLYEMREQNTDAYLMVANALWDELVHVGKYNADIMEELGAQNSNYTTTVDSLADKKNVIQDIPYPVNSVFGKYKLTYKNSDSNSDSDSDDEPSSLQEIKSKVAKSYEKYNKDHSINELYDITIERDFREAVMDFLYDNTIKLFKSAAEGNMLVKLTEISFTPNTELAGRVYDFSATVQEVAEYNIENCLKYGIQTLGSISDAAVDYSLQFGSLHQDFVANQNIVEIIRTLSATTERDDTTVVKNTCDHLSWVRLKFESKPQWIILNNTGATVYDAYDKIPLDKASKALYGYAIKIGLDNSSTVIFIDAATATFDLTDSQNDTTTTDIYEATIYNTYINGTSLYNIAYETLMDSTSTPELNVLEEQIIALAELYLKQLKFHGDFCITELMPYGDKNTILVDYFYRSTKTINLAYIQSIKTRLFLGQLSDAYNVDTDFIDYIRKTYAREEYVNNTLVSKTRIENIYDIKIEADENAVFEIQDICYIDDSSSSDSESHEHLIGRTGVLRLAATNSQNQEVGFEKIKYKGLRLHYHKPFENWIGTDDDNTVNIMKAYSKNPIHYDTRYGYDYTEHSLEFDPNDSRNKKEIDKLHSNFIYSYNNKNWTKINGTIYEAIKVYDDNHELIGWNVQVKMNILFDYIAQTSVTTYSE